MSGGNTSCPSHSTPRSHKWEQTQLLSLVLLLFRVRSNRTPLISRRCIMLEFSSPKQNCLEQDEKANSYGGGERSPVNNKKLFTICIIIIVSCMMFVQVALYTKYSQLAWHLICRKKLRNMRILDETLTVMSGTACINYYFTVRCILLEEGRYTSIVQQT